MKTCELLEAADKQTEQVRQKAQAMMDELVKTFKLSKGKNTYLQMFGAHSPISIAKLSLSLPTHLEGDDLEFMKTMLDNHVRKIIQKYFPQLEEWPPDPDIGEKEWYQKRVFYRAFEVPKPLRTKFNGLIHIKTGRT